MSTVTVMRLLVSTLILHRQSAISLGYELEIDDMEFDAILAAVQSGKADFGAAGMTVTEDRSGER